MEESSLFRNVIAIVQFMGEMGIRYPRSKFEEVLEYVCSMIEDGRVILIEEDGYIHTVLFYSICTKAEEFLKKPVWAYKEHDPKGDIIYVEKAASMGWNKKVRSELKETILNKYPQLTQLKWHKWGKVGDEERTIRRKRNV